MSGLNERQQAAYDLVMRDEDPIVFVTGPGGVGKSFLIDALREARQAVVVAPTGIAAINVQGKTIHRQFRVKTMVLDPKEDDDNFIPLWPEQEYVLQRMDLLIIDEVSMVRADLMDAIDRRMKQARHSKEPFGGVQTLLVGDPFQLPPVLVRKEERIFREVGEWQTAKWFDARVLRETGMKPFKLEQQMRQENQAFADILGRCRIGRPTESDLAVLNERVARVHPVGVAALYSMNRGVDAINETHIDTLEGPDFIFTRKVTGEWSGNHPAEEVRLRKGALVTMTTNSRDAWVNGDTGRVVELTPRSAVVKLNRNGSEHVLYSPEAAHEGARFGEPMGDHSWENWTQAYEGGRLRRKLEGVAYQIPVRVAAAMTIHKSQGQTLDAAYVGGDLGWAPGLGYVALSRVRSLAGLHLAAPVTTSALRVDPDARRLARLLTN